MYPIIDTRLIRKVDVGANFTAYQELKKLAHTYQPDLKDLPSYQHMVIGLISGAMGPFSNAPIDTIKTRKCTPRRDRPQQNHS
jgi:solute carrier family 25 citrate transporter 1